MVMMIMKNDECVLINFGDKKLYFIRFRRFE